MTRNNMKWAAMPIAALCLALAGCSSDDAVETPTATRPFTISASLGADNANAGTRAGIKPGNTDKSKEVFIWHTGDTFTAIAKNANGQNVMNDQSIFHTFTIDNNYTDASSNSASFSCSTFQPSAGSISLFAYYPADGAFTATNENKEYTYSVSATQTQTGANTDHLKQKMLMYATSSFTYPAAASLTFTHLTAMLRFTVTNSNATACKVTAITVTSSANSVFGTSGTITPNATDYSQAPTIGTTAKVASLTLNINDYALVANTTVEGYMLTLPGDALTDKTLTFTITVKDADGNKREYTSRTLAANEIIKKNGDATTWEAGKRYWFDLTLKDQLTVAVTVGAWTDGTEIPGGEAQEPEKNNN